MKNIKNIKQKIALWNEIASESFLKGDSDDYCLWKAKVRALEWVLE